MSPVGLPRCRKRCRAAPGLSSEAVSLFHRSGCGFARDRKIGVVTAPSSDGMPREKTCSDRLGTP
jgi:hypothetical protein